jgi:type IV secretion system protein VirB9
LTDIELQPGETITAILGGDTARWLVDKAQSGTNKGQQWHIYVKPLKSGIETNLIIDTDKHSYQVKLEASDWYSPIVGWTYPQEDAAIYRAKEEKEKEVVNLSHTSPDKLNFNYKFDTKKYPWSPEAVFDDGVKTYLRMPVGMSSDEAPALLIKDSKGDLLLVNYRVQSNCYVVDRIFNEAVLRVGKEIETIKRVSE